MSAFRVAARAALMLVLVALVLPAATVQPTTVSLSRGETAKAVDFDDGVVWVLVLGSDADDGHTLEDGDTDAIELLGLDLETGAAAAIGIPRDSYVDLHGNVGLARINQAYREDGAPLAARAVQELVGIRPDFVLVTGFDGFRSMTETVGGVDVVSSQRFVTDDGEILVRRGTNHFDGAEALDFAATRRSLANDFERAANHQALLLGFLRRIHEREDEQGFMEEVALSALGGLETDLPPTDLYRLAQAVTQVDPAKVTGCIVTGDDFTTELGADVITPDVPLAHRLGEDAKRDATLKPGCRG